MDIKKVVVIGSGTMGSGIAAHLCNANVPVTLLDLTTEISEKARDRIHKSRPPLLLDKTKIENIKVGNINDNFDVVKEADWVVEAVVERIDIKHNIYEKIFKNRKQGAIVSSNTSSIPIKVLSEKLTEEEKKDFCITHFFNPPRYLNLFEVIPSPSCDEDLLNFLLNYGEKFLGKTSILAKDTPAFIGNRIGTFGIQSLFHQVKDGNYTIEEIDKLTGSVIGRPKSATFRNIPFHLNI